MALTNQVNNNNNNPDLIFDDKVKNKIITTHSLERVMEEIVIYLEGLTVDSIPVEYQRCEETLKIFKLRGIPLIPTYKTTNERIVRCARRVTHNLRAFLYFFVSFGFVLNKADREYLKEVGALKKTALSWLLLDLDCQMESFLKFHTSWLFSKYAEQDKEASLPQSDWTSAGNFMFGPFQKWIKNRMHDKWAYQLFFSLMQVKSGCAPLQLPNVVKACQKHAMLLSREAETPHALLETVSQVSRQIGYEALKYQKPFKVPVPSSKACYQRSIANGGSKVEIHDFLMKSARNIEYMNGRDVWINDESVKTAVVRGDTEDDLGTLELFHGRLDPDNQDITEDEELLLFDIKTNRMTGPPNIGWEMVQTKLALELMSGSTFRASVVAIPEPFKVRIITKSDAYLNYYGKPLQKLLHKCIRNTKWGYPIGRPVTLEDVACYKSLPAGWRIVSGDYEAATDFLNSDAGRISLNEMIQFPIDETAKALLLETIGNQVIDYLKTLDSYKEDPMFREQVALMPEAFLMNNGQLMGSICSFLVLCVLNLSAFVHAARLYWDNPYMSIDDCVVVHALKINGDDILFKAPLDMIEGWMKITTSIGLKPSVGKNYVSRKFFTINSMLFVRKDTGPVGGVSDAEITYEPRLNMGLLFSTNPLVSNSKVVESPLTFGDSASSIQADFLRENYAEDQYLSWLYLHVNKESLTQAAMGRNWFVPKHLGGLGLKTERNLIEINKIQGRVAAYLMTRSSPEQLWEASLNMKSSQPDRSTLLAIKQVKEFGRRVGWVFGGFSVDQLMSNLMSADPFGRGDAPLETEIELLRARKRIFATQRKLSQACGSLLVPTLETLSSHQPLEVGLAREFTLVESREGSVYAPPRTYNQ